MNEDEKRNNLWIKRGGIITLWMEGWRKKDFVNECEEINYFITLFDRKNEGKNMRHLNGKK